MIDHGFHIIIQIYNVDLLLVTLVRPFEVLNIWLFIQILDSVASCQLFGEWDDSQSPSDMTIVSRPIHSFGSQVKHSNLLIKILQL